jgi:hypothetical protein
MKSIVLILLFFGIMSVVIGYVNQTKGCPAPKVEYRYIPRTFQQEQDDPVRVSQIFNTMFEEPTPWIRPLDTPKSREINRYFISQK